MWRWAGVGLVLGLLVPGPGVAGVLVPAGCVGAGAGWAWARGAGVVVPVSWLGLGQLASLVPVLAGWPGPLWSPVAVSRVGAGAGVVSPLCLCWCRHLKLVGGREDGLQDRLVLWVELSRRWRLGSLLLAGGLHQVVDVGARHDENTCKEPEPTLHIGLRHVLAHKVCATRQILSGLSGLSGLSVSPPM